MKIFPLIFLSIIALSGLGSAADNEEQAIAVLQSAAPQPEKEAACLRLKQIGTAKSVPILNSLLADENFSQWACAALETMPGREAGEALLAALSTAGGKAKAGVVDALGRRREMPAVPELIKLISNVDAVVALSAARALGRIGGNEAIAALRSARTAVPAQLKSAIADALLNCADKAVSDGDPKTAFKIFEEFLGPDQPAQVRAAAFRGVALAAQPEQVDLIVQALKGRDEAQQAVAIQLVRELPDRQATVAFANTLPEVPPTVQVALIEALSQRDDPAAAPSIAKAIHSDDQTVRVGALKALGALGDATCVGALAERAAKGSFAERAEARSALTSLHRGNVLTAILAEIRKAELPAKIELVQTLARRGERRAVPELFQSATSGERELRVAAIRALEKLADDGHLKALLGLIVNAQEDSARAAAVSAFVTVGARSKAPASFSELALNAMPGAPIPARGALLEAAGQIGGPNVPGALRAAVKDPNPEIRRTAVKVMAENAGDEARPDLLGLSREAATDDLKEIALRGYWRLVEGMNDRPATERFAAVREGLAAGISPSDVKLGLARLAELNTPDALALAQSYRPNAAVCAEAESACLQIVTRFSAAQITAAEAALRQLAEAQNTRVRSEAQALLTKLEAQAGYIAPWLVNGPYRQEGKEAQQLFDVAFAPELPPASRVEWHPLSSTSGLTNWWFADLAQVVGGNHCVVYLKTRVYCPREQPVSLEIGTDDGVKLWVNGALVHAHNAVPGFTPGEDKAQAALKEGWNDFLVKITQHTLGCAAAIRVRNSDGTPIAGLRVEATE